MMLDIHKPAPMMHRNLPIAVSILEHARKCRRDDGRFDLAEAFDKAVANELATTDVDYLEAFDVMHYASAKVAAQFDRFWSMRDGSFTEPRFYFVLVVNNDKDYKTGAPKPAATEDEILAAFDKVIAHAKAEIENGWWIS